jgi:hypothetical protein
MHMNTQSFVVLVCRKLYGYGRVAPRLKWWSPPVGGKVQRGES